MNNLEEILKEEKHKYLVRFKGKNEESNFEAMNIIELTYEELDVHSIIDKLEEGEDFNIEVVFIDDIKLLI
jgi:hypothetical protein